MNLKNISQESQALLYFSNIDFFVQIKIWFQNRRTKWKRKYTNDLEQVIQTAKK